MNSLHATVTQQLEQAEVTITKLDGLDPPKVGDENLSTANELVKDLTQHKEGLQKALRRCQVLLES